THTSARFPYTTLFRSDERLRDDVVDRELGIQGFVRVLVDDLHPPPEPTHLAAQPPSATGTGPDERSPLRPPRREVVSLPDFVDGRAGFPRVEPGATLRPNTRDGGVEGPGFVFGCG